MADDLIFIDSFQHYATADGYQKYHNPRTMEIGSGGPFGANCLRNTSGSGPEFTFSENLETIYIGMRIKLSLSQQSSSFIFQFKDAGTIQISIAIRADGRIAIINALNTEVAATVSYALFLETYYYFEAKVVIGNSGSVEIKVNEVTVLSYSGDTQQTSNNYATHVSLFQTLPSGQQRFGADLYIHKSEFLGDIRIGVIRPNGTGTHTDGTAVGAATVWQASDDTTPDADSTYIEEADEADKTTMNMEDVTLDGDCLGIQVLVSARKDNANVRKIRVLVIADGTEDDNSGLEHSLAMGYIYYRTTYSIPPGGGTWTDTILDGVEAGFEVVDETP